MHATAMQNANHFFRLYTDHLEPGTIIEIGSQNVNGSLRSISNPNHKYIGLDFVSGKGVDVVITDPYKYPMEDNSADIVVTSSCFEHSEFFWLSFVEAMRILKQDGIMYVNAPSNGSFHRFPVDCWRFYPDSGVAMAKWARQCGYSGATLIESFVSEQSPTAGPWDLWSDFVGVFVKDENYINKYPNRIIFHKKDFTNGRLYGTEEIINMESFSEDHRRRR